jgi:WD40 repeat protein
LPPTIAALPGAVPISGENIDQMKLLTTYPLPYNNTVWDNPGSFFNFDGSLLLITHDTTVTIYDAVSGAVRMIIPVPVTLDKHKKASVSAAFVPDGKTIETIASDKSVRFWEIATGAQTRQSIVQMPDAKTGRLPDGTYVTLGDKGLINGRGQTIIPLTVHHDVMGNAYSYQTALPNIDWSALVVYGEGSVQLELWDTVSAILRANLRAHTTSIVDATFSGNGRILASLDSTGIVIIWDVLTGSALQTLKLPKPPAQLMSPYSYSMLLNRDGSAFIFIDENGTIHLVNVATGNEQATLPTSGTLSGQPRLLMSPDGSTLVLVSDSFATLYGVPTDMRPVFAAVQVTIKPISINVREKPSFASPIIAHAKGGLTIASGRDNSGQFIYLEAYGGWVNAGSVYIDSGAFDLNQLPIRDQSHD